MGIALEKPACMYTPDDFRRFPGADLIYEGELNSFYYNMQSELITNSN